MIENFAKKLNLLMPNPKDFSGDVKEILQAEESELMIQPRLRRVKYPLEYTDSLIDLFETYQFESFCVGYFSSENILQMIGERFILFGSSGGALVAIDTLSKEVVELDFTNTSIIGYAAKNSDCFLNTILVAVEFYIQKILHGLTIDSDSPPWFKEYSDKMMETAGGKKYGAFWNGIMGI